MSRGLSVHWPWLVIGTLAVGIGLATAQHLLAEPRGEDGCSTAAPLTQDAVLADSSDGLAPSQLKRAAALVRSFALRSGLRHRFALFTGGGGDTVDLNEKYGGCARTDVPGAGGGWREKVRKEFLANSEGFMAGLADAQQPTTPLFEATELLRLRPDICDPETTLWILSDFIQNTARFSHYPSSPHYRKPSVRDLPVRSELGCRFAAIRLVFVQRPGMSHIQTEEAKAYWIADLSRIADRVTMEAL